MRGLTRIDAQEFKEPPPPVPWIIEGFVAQGALTLLAGVGGLGKSSLALALAAASAKGESYCAGFRVAQELPMMYVDAENGIYEMHRRAHQFGIFDGFYEFEGNLEEHEPSLSIHASEAGPAFIVLDSCRKLYPDMDEDNSKSVLPILSRLQVLARETDCGILLLHHTTKGGGIFRGSGEFQNRPEITVTMKRDSHGSRFLDWEKCRMGIEPMRKYLTLDNHDDGTLSWSESRPVRMDWTPPPVP